MSSERMSASAHIGPGISGVTKNVEQAAALLGVLDYGSRDVMFDGYRLVRKLLLESVELIDDAILQRLKSEVGE